MEENFHDDDVDIYCDLGQDEDYKSFEGSQTKQKKMSISSDNSISSYKFKGIHGNKPSRNFSKNNCPKEPMNMESCSTNDRKLISTFKYQEEIGKEFDFYSEVLATEISEKQEKKQKEKLEIDKLLYENKELRKLNENLSSELAMINKKNAVLKKNISALYKTAKEELNRKNDLITELREKMDDMIFRRSGLPARNPALNAESNLNFANIQQSNQRRHQLNCNSEVLSTDFGNSHSVKLERKRKVVSDEWAVKTDRIIKVEKDNIVIAKVSHNLNSDCKDRETRVFQDNEQSSNIGSDSMENPNSDLEHGEKPEDFNRRKSLFHGRYFSNRYDNMHGNGNHSAIQSDKIYVDESCSWLSNKNFDRFQSNNGVNRTMGDVNTAKQSEKSNAHDEFSPAEKNDFPKLYKYNGYAVPLAVKKRILGYTKLPK